MLKRLSCVRAFGLLRKENKFFESCLVQFERRMSSLSKRIGTHSGNFHCDDVLACYMLRNHTNVYRHCDIVRSREASLWKDLDIVVDVGDEFDPINHRFDHHQSGFMQTFDENHKTKLSSAGLVYKYFGKEIVRDILVNQEWSDKSNMFSIEKNENKEMKNEKIDDKTIDIIWNRIYDVWIEEIDAIDNGIKLYDNVSESEANYRVSSMISSRISRFNPAWNDPLCDDNDYILKCFYKAMDYIGNEFRSQVMSCYKEWLPAREIVYNGLIDLKKTHESGQVLMLKQQCPWQDHFWNLCSSMNVDPLPLYVLFPATNGGWRVRAVPAAPFSFESKKALPKEWRAKRNEELNKIANVDGCVFVHSSGFIGGNKTLDGAKQMAQKAIEH